MLYRGPKGCLVQQRSLVQPKGALGLDVDVHHYLRGRIVGLGKEYHGAGILSSPLAVKGKKEYDTCLEG